MAALIFPQEVTDHLEAAIQLSNRRVHLRFLEEADVLLAFNLPTAAVLVAGVVLESISAEGSSGDRQRMEKWLDLRNSVAHAHVASVTLDQAKEMVEDVRRSLTQATKPAAEPPTGVRGKYKFVATSAAEFIRRKTDELRLEHDEHGD